MEQPRAARARQVALPMPPLAPVTRAKWFLRSVVILDIFKVDIGDEEAMEKGL